MLIEFRKHSRPSFIRERASEIYKKCLSFKVKLKNHKIDNLGYSYTPGPFCIDYNNVKLFTSEYIDWGRKAYYLWNDIYSLRDKYYSLYAYEDWQSYVKNSAVLKEKKVKIQKLIEDALSLLNTGKDMILKHDESITVEYNTNAFEMSLYEREIEIAIMYEGDEASDEEYCYVYTLECEIFVFYVGIAGNPRERFEQHLRGAFSDEAHLFKSKFIQKYHSEVKQKIVYEGTRKDCKKIEREYISKHNPLGNMTQGGEG
jgi:predicted GIY-YIG superfamily endonuclease